MTERDIASIKLGTVLICTDNGELAPDTRIIVGMRYIVTDETNAVTGGDVRIEGAAAHPRFSYALCRFKLAPKIRLPDYL